MNSPVLTIDVAHPPRHPAEVEAELLGAWSEVRNSPSMRILKIVHGHGSTGKGGSTKELVRNWAFHHRSKFRSVIEGEHYNMYDGETQQMRKNVGQYNDADLNNVNPGITCVWVK